jgi:ABC-type phosphate transport system substrate-binding protein
MNNERLKHVKAVSALLVTLLIAPSGSLAETVVVVSSKSSATAFTSSDQVADIFLGKLSTLPGAGQAVPVDQPEGSAVREEFYSKTTGKSAAQLKAYWSKIIFTGKGQPPKEVADSNGIKKLVADNPNIIGYMNRSEVDASVKVLFSVR